MIEQKNKILIALICVFFISLGLTIAVGFSNQQEPRMLIKSVIPAYDEESTVVVSDNGVVFNDKNQEVKYKVVIENPNNYDVKVSDIVLSTPTEEFLEYDVENLKLDDVISANGTKELVVSFETVKKDGWGRNFNDELTANISFAKVIKLEEPTPTPNLEPEVEKEETEIEKEPILEERPKEEQKEEIKEEEKVEVVAPVKDSNEVKEKFELIKEYEIEEDEIVFSNIQKVVDKQKIDVWIYSDPIYLGRFEVEVKDGKTKIIGLSEALEKHGIEEGNHSLVLQTEAGEKLGYVEVKVNNKKLEKVNQEETIPEEEITNKIEDDVEKTEENQDKRDNKINALGIVLVIVTGVTGTAIIVILIVNKKNKTVAAIVVLISGISLVKADVLIELPLTFNVSFESQNVMKSSGCYFDLDDKSISSCEDYWLYASKIKSFYVQNDITQIENFEYEFDVSNEQGKGRIKAYLLKNVENNEFYDLYLQADGLIYANEDSSLYFAEMINLDKIDNLSGIDTSKVTNMLGMFHRTGYNSQNFVADLSHLNTSKVTNMMRMFYNYGYRSTALNLNLENFDTSNVTNMKSMFEETGHYTKNLKVDLSSFDTSKVTDMTYMFKNTGYSSEELNLGISKLNTSSVTNMKYMFTGAGHFVNSLNLDLSSFDTSNVTNMYGMFMGTGRMGNDVSLNVSNFDTSNVTTMAYMFYELGHNSANFTLDVSGFDMSKVTDATGMFQYTGHESTVFSTSINITNPNVKYTSIFSSAFSKGNSKMVLNYISETEDVVDNIVSNYKYNPNIVKGKLIVDVDNLAVGDEVHIGAEKFNVISQTDDEITMLAKYNLGTDYKQSEIANNVFFSNTIGWEYTPGPKEIDIQIWSVDPKNYVNHYVNYLQTKITAEDLYADLITLKQLEALECKIPENYGDGSEKSCYDSSYAEWLINGQSWWTKSAQANSLDLVWNVSTTGYLSQHGSIFTHGVRPVITISKENLKSYLK